MNVVVWLQMTPGARGRIYVKEPEGELVPVGILEEDAGEPGANGMRGGTVMVSTHLTRHDCRALAVELWELADEMDDKAHEQFVGDLRWAGE